MIERVNMHDYDRTAASTSFFAKLLEDHCKVLADEMKEKAMKYCGPGSKCQAKVEVANGYLNVSVWLDMGTDSNQDEAEELTKILLGGDALVGPHILVAGVWVAALKSRLG